jgi:hypothetical protein
VKSPVSLRSLDDFEARAFRFASSLSQKFPNEKVEWITHGMHTIAHVYKHRLERPNEPNERTALKSKIEISIKASELKQMIEKAGFWAYGFAVSELEIPDGINARWAHDSREWKWLSRLASDLQTLEKEYDMTLPIPGRPSNESNIAESSLIYFCVRYFSDRPSYDMMEDFDINVKRLAREIHYLVTGEKAPQKFKKLKIDRPKP